MDYRSDRQRGLADAYMDVKVTMSPPIIGTQPEADLEANEEPL